MAAMFLFFIVGCASIIWAFTKKAARTTKHVAVGTVTKATPKVKQAARTTGYVAVGTAVKAAPQVKKAARTTKHVAVGVAVKAAPKAASIVAKGKAQTSAFKTVMKAAREAYNNAQ